MVTDSQCAMGDELTTYRASQPLAQTISFTFLLELTFIVTNTQYMTAPVLGFYSLLRTPLHFPDQPLTRCFILSSLYDGDTFTVWVRISFHFRGQFSRSYIQPTRITSTDVGSVTSR